MDTKTISGVLHLKQKIKIGPCDSKTYIEFEQTKETYNIIIHKLLFPPINETVINENQGRHLGGLG